MPSSGDPVTAENETLLPPTPQAIRWQCFLGAIEGMASQQTGSVQQSSTTATRGKSSSSSSGSANGTLIRDALKDAGFLHRTVEFVMQVSVMSDLPSIKRVLHTYVATQFIGVIPMWQYCLLVVLVREL
jgi:hypothetical protein